MMFAMAPSFYKCTFYCQIATDDKNSYNSSMSCTIMKKKNQELLIKVGAIFVVLLFVGTAVTAMVFS